MYDAELLELAADSGNLTETAQQALGDEMRKRGLALARTAGAARRMPDPMLERAATALGADPGAPQLVEDTPDTADEADAPHEYTWKTLLCECETAEEALQLAAALGHSGIESWIEGRRGSYSPYSQLDQGPPRILVPADRLEEAREVASRPIPKEIVEQTEMEAPEFEAPVCPKCGAGDPVLDGVDPVNTWFCEACENEWTDGAADVKDDHEKA
jgi:ribosomal protein L37AE/L43A